MFSFSDKFRHGNGETDKTDALEVPPGTGESAIDGVLQNPAKLIPSATTFLDGTLAWGQVLSGFLLMFSS